MKHHLTFFVALLLAPPVTLHAADAPRKPNFLIILADDLGYADLGCQGSREAVTPQIDSLAANGVRCTAGYVTAPQCCPSRAGLITGRYQNRFGFEANWPAAFSGKAGLPTSERTVADQLRAAGYVTGLIGKWHLGDAETMRPYNRGFDETLWHANGGVLFPDKNTGFISKLYRGSEPAPPVNHARGLRQSLSMARTRLATILAVASRATCWRAAFASRFSCSGKAASQPAEPSTSL